MMSAVRQALRRPIGLAALSVSVRRFPFDEAYNSSWP